MPAPAVAALPAMVRDPDECAQSCVRCHSVGPLARRLMALGRGGPPRPSAGGIATRGRCRGPGARPAGLGGGEGLEAGEDGAEATTLAGDGLCRRSGGFCPVNGRPQKLARLFFLGLLPPLNGEEGRMLGGGRRGGGGGGKGRGHTYVVCALGEHHELLGAVEHGQGVGAPLAVLEGLCLEALPRFRETSAFFPGLVEPPRPRLESSHRESCSKAKKRGTGA